MATAPTVAAGAFRPAVMFKFGASPAASVFKQYDADGDGHLTMDEIMLAAEQVKSAAKEGSNIQSSPQAGGPADGAPAQVAPVGSHRAADVVHRPVELPVAQVGACDARQGGTVVRVPAVQGYSGHRRGL